MTPQQAQKETLLQQKVDQELHSILVDREYCVKFPDASILQQAVKEAIQHYSPDTLRCSFETYKALYTGKSVNDYTFHEMQIALNMVASATPEQLRGCCYGYINVLEYVHAKAADWNKTVAVMRQTLDNKHRKISTLITH